MFSLDEIKEHPLFMTADEVEEKVKKGEVNSGLTAIEDLLYNDRSKEEIAEDLKEKGNDQMKRNTKNSCKAAIDR